MARRNGRKGSWLLTDDLTGFVIYGEQAKTGYYGEVARKPYKRNLQEIAVGMDDPEPVPLYRGPQYEVTTTCVAETAPLYVGETNIPTNQNNMAFQALNLDPGVGDMEVGCTFRVH